MALAYLLCPTFQIENTAGKPATGGWLEVYVAGSRTKYYCASDFDGTLHPFRIPLDSLGSNIVLADDAGSYDVYVYNRYGGEMMSRYNVKPGSGGGIGSITSADGSIIITPTENGLDLRTNSKAPSILRATAQNLSADGQFQFSELQRDGQDAVVDTNGRVMVNEGWWHFDATVRLRWPGDPNVNGTQSISLYTANASDSTSFDLSYAHSDTIQVNGEFKAENDGTQFVLGVTGVQPGMTVELVDYGIHSIIGEGAGGKYNAGDGIDIDEPNRVISVDFDEVQEKLTAGTGITIDNEGVISVDESAIQEIFPVTYNSTTFQEIRTALIAGKLPVMFRNDGADIALQVQRIPLHTFFNVGGSLGSSYAQFWSPYVYTSSSPSLPPYALFAVYSASYDFETHNTTWSTSYKYISEQSDWAESDATKLTFIKNKPDLSVYATGAELTAGLATKQDTLTAGTGIAIDSNNVISSTVSENTFNAIYGVTTLSEIEDAVEAGNAVVVTGIPSEPGMTLPLVTFRPNLNSATFYAYTLTAAYLVSIGPAGHWEYHVYGAQADWNESTSSAPAYIKNKPTIPSGSQLVPAATSSDAGEVLTVDQNGDPAWAPAQAPISAGNGIDITNNVVSAKVDGTSVTFNASGELETIAAPQVQSNWTEADPTDVSFIRNKPDQTNLVAGTNITIVDDAQNNTVTISAASVSVPVQDVTIDNVSVVNAQGVAEIPRQVNADWNSSAGASEILNKPTIPPALSAGNGIDITNNVISASLLCCFYWFYYCLRLCHELARIGDLSGDGGCGCH